MLFTEVEVNQEIKAMVGTALVVVVKDMQVLW